MADFVAAIEALSANGMTLTPLLEKVRSLFRLLYRITTEECPGFQIIVTEHANLRDEWFQKSLTETPWTKHPALVPDDWPDARE